jgi:flagellar basal body-associated protein FliL
MKKNIQLTSKALHLPMVFPTSQILSLSTRVLAASFICLAISFPMGAQAGEKEQNQVQEETAGVPSLQILLKPIMVPITGASQYYAPIKLFIEAVNKDHIQKICQYRPLIVDAILQVLSRQPIPVIRRKLYLRNLPA